MKPYNRKSACALVAILLLSNALLPIVHADNNIAVLNNSEVSSQYLNAKDYTAYLDEIKDAKKGSEKIKVSAEDVTNKSTNVKIVKDFKEQRESAIVLSSDDYGEFNFFVEENTLYKMNIRYMAANSSGGDLEISLTINDFVPFKEVNLISLKRAYSQEIGDFSTNISGNDIKPNVAEVFEWSDYLVKDSSGFQSSPFWFYLKSGNNTVRITGSRGDLAISSISFEPYKETDTYENYLKKHENETVKKETENIIVEGEKFSRKNSRTVLPAVDRSSPDTFPQSTWALKLNTVGGKNWSRIGDSITWDINVKESGLYEISLRARQNIKDGIFSSRKLLIDGKLPFEEASALKFDYSAQWENAKLAKDGSAYKFYLKAGTHTITLEAVAGDISQMIGRIQSSINDMNKIYRRIILITGTSPDVYRDYSFSELIPDEIEEMKAQKKLLTETVEFIDKESGGGSYTSIIKKIIFQLEKMTENPEHIAKYLVQFKSNLGAMSAWLLTALDQPLQLDRFYIVPANKEIEVNESRFLNKIGFWFGCFFSSFSVDYSSIGQSTGEDYEDTLSVWVQSGRDQAEIIRNLVDTQFAKTHNTKVKIELVAQGTLLQSVLAGMSPDVAMDNPVTEPINYAVRNSVVDLQQFEDFEKFTSKFHKASLEPYTFKGKTYALPQTFSFFMFFYRKDIFNEYGFKTPKSWNDLIKLIPTLQRNHLDVGIPHDINAYTMFLYQNKGELYLNDGEKTNLKSNVAVETFEEFTQLFTLYDLPFAYDFANRFRSGEMPCGVQDYLMYNQLIVFAPEIKGLWEMIPVPGKLQKDGSVVNTSVGTGANTNMMLMKSSSKQKLAWEFMKWYMGTDIQSAFAQEMESVLGPAAKVATANKEAISQMTWNSSEYKSMLNQMEDVRSIPEVPGGYYLSRIMGFAMNRIYNSSGSQSMAENPTDVLSDYIDELNYELLRKRQEFGVDK